LIPQVRNCQARNPEIPHNKYSTMAKKGSGSQIWSYTTLKHPRRKWNYLISHSFLYLACCRMVQ
jgi:hypothetical protein